MRTSQKSASASASGSTTGVFDVRSSGEIGRQSLSCPSRSDVRNRTTAHTAATLTEFFMTLLGSREDTEGPAAVRAEGTLVGPDQEGDRNLICSSLRVQFSTRGR